MFIALILFVTSLGTKYEITKDCTHTFGTVNFPTRDADSPRIMKLCNTTDVVLEHELLHICMHDHPHNFANYGELSEHILAQYSEEEAVELLTPCMVDNRENFYKQVRNAIH